MGDLLGNLGIDWKILIAQTINFLIVLWLLNRFVFKKITKHLESRKDRIERGLVLTEKAEREIERINEARHREIEKAKSEAEKILIDARSTAIEKEKAAITLARLESEKILSKAKREAEEEKTRAVLNGKTEMKKLAILIAEKLLSRSTKPEDQDTAAEEVLNQLEKMDYAKQS